MVEQVHTDSGGSAGSQCDNSDSNRSDIGSVPDHGGTRLHQEQRPEGNRCGTSTAGLTEAVGPGGASVRIVNNPEQCVDNTVTGHPGSVVQHHVTTEHSKLLPWLMLCAILSGVAVAMAIFATIWAGLSAHETKQLQIQVMDHNALLIREGFIQVTDETYGPAANLEYKPRKTKERKRMGGLVCHNIRAAILQFDAVPTDAKQLPKFDQQMRALYANPSIAESLEAMDPSPLLTTIAILSKTTWSVSDRTTLYDIIESLYE